jgi:DNA-binding NarL/FixJ family response regulator
MTQRKGEIREAFYFSSAKVQPMPQAKSARLRQKVAELEAAAQVERIADATAQRAVGQFATLTAREREVLNCFIEQKNDKLVALTLGLCIQTVHNYMAAILSKLDLPSRIDLVAAFAADSANIQQQGRNP